MKRQSKAGRSRAAQAAVEERSSKPRKKLSFSSGQQLHSGDENHRKSQSEERQTRRLYRRLCLLSDSYHCYYHHQTSRAAVISRAIGLGLEKMDLKWSVIGFFGTMLLLLLFFSKASALAHSHLIQPHKAFQLGGLTWAT